MLGGRLNGSLELLEVDVPDLAAAVSVEPLDDPLDELLEVPARLPVGSASDLPYLFSKCCEMAAQSAPKSRKRATSCRSSWLDQERASGAG
jgi:hypothetical protein